MIWTVSNLFPRPDRPHMGAFNVRLFDEMAGRVALRNVCLVPGWRVWKWEGIRRWACPRCLRFPTTYVPVGYVPLVGRDLSARLYAACLRSAARQWGQAEGVLAAWLYPDGVAVARMGREIGVRVWIMVQGSDTFHLQYPVRRRKILRACAGAAGVICVARHLKHRLVAAGVEDDKVHVVPNGVDAGLFRFRGQDEARRVLAARGLCDGADVEARWILFVGNLVHVKGPEICVESFARIVQSGRGGSALRLFVVGDGPMRKTLESQAAELGLSASMRFVGVRPADEIAVWMSAADALCLSSRDEGMPNVVLEALACGLPVAATDVGACREMLEGEPACRLSPPGDAVALADALGGVLRAPVDRSALAARHGKRTWGMMAEEVLGIMAGGGGERR